jgi:acetylglutamate kinase
VYLTDVPGVKGSDGNVVRTLSPDEISVLTDSGVLSGGMLPKTQSCLDALRHGVREVHIMPGARAGMLQSVVRGEATEGTCIHAHS